MDQGQAGKYRTIYVRVGAYRPPPPVAVSGLMFDLLQWWNKDARELSPVRRSAILHYRFEAIHPFADGNGRTGRALALWELYRRGFDTHHIFAVDEYYWEDRPRYYAELASVNESGEDLTAWLEYCTQGLAQTLERAWLRIQAIQAQSAAKIVLRPKQERLIALLRDRGSLCPPRFGRRWPFRGKGPRGTPLSAGKPCHHATSIKCCRWGKVKFSLPDAELFGRHPLWSASRDYSGGGRF